VKSEDKREKAWGEQFFCKKGLLVLELKANLGTQQAR